MFSRLDLPGLVAAIDTFQNAGTVKLVAVVPKEEDVARCPSLHRKRCKDRTIVLYVSEYYSLQRFLDKLYVNMMVLFSVVSWDKTKMVTLLTWVNSKVSSWH